MEVYLDNAATTPLTDSVKEYLISILDEWGNPSSLHSQGQKPKQIISQARQSVAEFINADSKDIYFTSGGSASNTLAINGYYQKNDCTIFYSPIALFKHYILDLNTFQLKLTIILLSFYISKLKSHSRFYIPIHIEQKNYG